MNQQVPRALITGITGQDGLYLGEFLAAKGYEVFGMVRGQSNPKIPVVEDVIPSIQLLEGDLRDLSSLISVLETAQPDEIYNLGAISFVGLSFKQPELTGDITAMGVLRMLEAVRIHTQGSMNGVRFYQASSSEMFGQTTELPQRETTQFHPRSPYGVGKVFGHYVTQNYRESYDAWACSGILFNHESPRRGFEFLTRKVTRAVARIALGLQKVVAVGNMDVSRDWGFAGDYVRAGPGPEPRRDHHRVEQGQEQDPALPRAARPRRVTGPGSNPARHEHTTTLPGRGSDARRFRAGARTPLGAGRVPIQRYGADFTQAAKAFHACELKARREPSGSLLSRTRTAPGTVPNLRAQAATGTAVAGRPPHGRQGHLHRSSAAFMIRSRDAPFGSVSARSASKRRVTWATVSSVSDTCTFSSSLVWGRASSTARVLGSPEQAGHQRRLEKSAVSARPSHADERPVAHRERQVPQPFLDLREDARVAEELARSPGQVRLRRAVTALDRADQRPRIPQLGAQVIAAQAGLVAGVAARLTARGISSILEPIGGIPVLTAKEPATGPDSATVSINFGTSPGEPAECICIWAPSPGASPDATAGTIAAVPAAIRTGQMGTGIRLAET